MKFGYTIVYVPDVAASLTFFETAFGFKRRFLHESGDYGELETGETTLSFCSQRLAGKIFAQGFVYADRSEKPLGVELAFVTDDVEAAHRQALAAGASEVASPHTEPWGQTVSYVRCPDGSLIDLCTPMGA